MFAKWENKSSILAVGLMSGTSLDGIDAAVVRITGSGFHSKVDLLHYEAAAYDAELRDKLKQLCSPDLSSSAAVCSMNFYMGKRFAEAAVHAVEQAGLSIKDIDLISSHGQTLWHIPEAEARDPYSMPSTLQIGDLSVIAKHTGVVTVGDFRPADMAAGGQGAPLVPYGDFILFRDESRGRLLQNIGGIGNCTALPAGGGPEALLAFDTGPGNMIIDEIVQVLSAGRFRYDDGGSWAAKGKADESLVDEMMAHPFFHIAPPKSTGRELFGKDYAARFLEEARTRGMRDEDIVATATFFTARSIAEGCRKFVFPRYDIQEVIVTGGGSHNLELMRMLSRLMPERTVRTSGSMGYNDDAKEAVIFALLGNDFMHGIPNNIPAATGAGRPTIMGKLALP